MPPLTVRLRPDSISFALPMTDWGAFPTSLVFPSWEPQSSLFIADSDGVPVILQYGESLVKGGVSVRATAFRPSEGGLESDHAQINPIAPYGTESGKAAVHALLLPITAKILSDIEAYLVSPEFSLEGLDHQIRAFVLVAEHVHSMAALQRLLDDVLLKRLPQMLAQSPRFDAVAGAFSCVRSVRAADTLRDFVFAQCDAFFTTERKNGDFSRDKDAIKEFWGTGVDTSSPAAFLHSVCWIVSEKTRFGAKTLRQAHGQNVAGRFQSDCQRRINHNFRELFRSALERVREAKFADDAESWEGFSSLLPYLQKGVLDELARQEYVDAFSAVLDEQDPIDAIRTARLFTMWLKSTSGAYSAFLSSSVARHLTAAEIPPQALAVLVAQDAVYRHQEDGVDADGPFVPFFVAESQKWDRLDDVGCKAAYHDFYRNLYLDWIGATYLRDGFALPSVLSPRRGGRLVVGATSLVDDKMLKALAHAAEVNKGNSPDFGPDYKNSTAGHIAKASRVQDFLHLLGDHGWVGGVSDMIRLVDEFLALDRSLFSALRIGFPTWLNRFGFEREDFVAFHSSSLKVTGDASFEEGLVISYSKRQLAPKQSLENLFWSLLYGRDRIATLGQEFIKDPEKGIIAKGALADMMRAVLPDYFSGLFGEKDPDSRTKKNIFYSRRIFQKKVVPSVRDELKEAISESGPLLRKFLQNYLESMASRELQGYLDDVYENLPLFEWSQYQTTLETLVGADFGAAFPRFDPPQKAGTVAQTHFASYKDSDGDISEVVVKLRRPNYFAEVDAEKSVLAEKFKPYAFGPKLLGRVVEITKREGDFRNEARGMLELRALYKYARVVKLIAYGEDALIMERAAGRSLRDWQNTTDETPAAIKARYEALSKTFEEWLESALFAEDGAFHGDPHAGNLFYDPTNARPFQYIDFGNWHALKPKQRQLIVAFAKAFAGRDEGGVLAAIAEQCSLTALNEKDAEVLTAKMRELWGRGEMSTGELMETILMQGLDLAPYAVSFQRGITSFQNNLTALQQKYAAQVQGALTDDDVSFFKSNGSVARQIGIFARHFSPMELMALAMQNPLLLEFVSMT